MASDDENKNAKRETWGTKITIWYWGNLHAFMHEQRMEHVLQIIVP